MVLELYRWLMCALFAIELCWWCLSYIGGTCTLSLLGNFSLVLISVACIVSIYALDHILDDLFCET